MAETFQIRPVGWSDAAAELLASAMPDGSPEDLRQQIEEAGAQLFEVIAEAGRIGFYVLRVDRSASGCEGVMVAGAGEWKGRPLIELIVGVVEKQFIGCRSIRIHTERAGMARRLVRLGYSAGEIVLRKTLDGR